VLAACHHLHYQQVLTFWLRHFPKQILQATGLNVERFLSDPAAILPPLSQRREAVCGDPAATSRAWDRVMEHILEALMG